MAYNGPFPQKVNEGATGDSSVTAFALLAGGTTTTGALQSIANGAAASTWLIGNGSGSLSSFSATPRLTALGIGATAGASGLTFDGTNLLSNYATGTFTPTKVGATTAGSTSYSTQVGFYTRVGFDVTVSVVVTGTAATGTGNINYGGLPFTINAANNYHGALYMASQTWPALHIDIMASTITASTTCVANSKGSSQGVSAIQMANVAFNERFSMTYKRS